MRRIAQVLLPLWCVLWLVASGGPAGASTTIFDANGNGWDIRDSTDTFGDDGQIGDGGQDAFDGFGEIDVRISDGAGAILTPYTSVADLGLTFDGGRRWSTTTPPTFSGVTVGRSLYSPATETYMRYIDTFTNTSGASRQVEVPFGGNLGSDERTTVTGTSSGDLILDSADAWGVTIQSEGLDPDGPAGDSPVGYAVRSPSVTGVLTGVNDQVFPYDTPWSGDGNGALVFSFRFSLAPGETKSLAYFVYQGLAEDETPPLGGPIPAPGSEIAAARTRVSQLVANPDFGDLTVSQRASIVNWNAAPTISDVGNQSTTSGVATPPIAFTIGDLETPAADLTVTATSSNTALVPDANIALEGSGASRTVTITPAAGLVGSTTITLTVTDAGDLTASDTFVLTVDKAPQSITFTSTAPASPVVGGTYTATASASSGLPVTFSSGTPGTCTVSAAGAVTFTATGPCVVQADQAGNASVLAAPQVTQTMTVAKAPQSITFTSAAPASPVVGGTYTATATASSGLPVTFSSGAPGTCTVSAAGAVSFTATGPCVVQADQAGNASFDPAPQVTQTMTVGKAPQTITFTSTAPASPVVGGTYTATATASSDLPVTFSSGSPSVCTVTAGGEVSFTATGPCVVRADQAGNATFDPAPQVTQTMTVAKAPQTITFGPPPVNPVVGGSYTPSATGGGSGNPVVFTSATPAVCTLSGSTVNFVGIGTCTINANQAGNASYDPAAQVPQTFTVAKATPTISTVASPGNLVGAPVRDVATLAGGFNPTGNVTFRLFSDNACDTQVFTSTHNLPSPVTSDWATPASAGTYRWIATYNGDANNNVVAGACNAPNESVTLTPFVAPTYTRIIQGDLVGPVTIAAGESVLIDANARVVGPVTVQPGGAVTVLNAKIARGLVADKPSFLSICGSDISPPSTGAQALGVANAAVLIRIGDPANSCAGNRFAGTVNLTANLATTFGANSVSHAATINNGGNGATVIKANTFFGSLGCTGNNPAPTNAGQPNTAGSKTGQCTAV
jgi:hypothetical protein